MIIPDNRQGQHLGIDRGYANVTPISCIQAKVPERRRFIKKESNRKRLLINYINLVFPFVITRYCS